jgi:hypothetical protein
LIGRTKESGTRVPKNMGGLPPGADVESRRQNKENRRGLFSVSETTEQLA